MSSTAPAVSIEALPLPPNRLGESPLWHAGEQALYWCDIPARELHRYHPATQAHRQWALDAEAGCCAVLVEGGLLLALRSGLARFDPASGRVQPWLAPPYDPARERFNDGKVDPHGRFWVGTIYEPRDRPAATLYRLGPDGLAPQAGDCTVSNGLAWSPDGHRLYWADTTAHTVYTLALDADGAPCAPRQAWRTFARRGADEPLERYGGRPDGAAMDAQGHYWVAMYEGQCLLRIAPDGTIAQTVPLPVRCPTMPCFGGSDLRTLYVTTARDKRPAEELARQPWAGCVLQLRVEVPGQPIPAIASAGLPPLP